jgi:hypothetical protein
MKHHLVRCIIAFAIADVSGTMTTIVGDIERTFASRGRRQVVGNAVRIDTIVARGIGRILLNQFHHGLRKNFASE